MTPPVTLVDPGWLALRGPADARARTAAAGPLAAELSEHLTSRTRRSGRPAGLVDVGAGTGAGAAWLRPLLSVRQDWRLIDVDPSLLAVAAPVRDGWARPVVADIADLASLLHAEPADALTCQALLDVLTAEQVESMLAPALQTGAAVLVGLTVTGRVSMAPAHPDDGLIEDAFNAHQRRAGRLGPDAGGHAAEILRSHGYLVTVAGTPWRLGASDRALAEAWLRGRAEAAAEQAPRHAGRIERWLRSRTEAARRGEIAATVGHVDVLGLPPVR